MAAGMLTAGPLRAILYTLAVLSEWCGGSPAPFRQCNVPNERRRKMASVDVIEGRDDVGTFLEVLLAD